MANAFISFMLHIFVFVHSFRFVRTFICLPTNSLSSLARKKFLFESRTTICILLLCRSIRTQTFIYFVCVVRTIYPLVQNICYNNNNNNNENNKSKSSSNDSSSSSSSNSNTNRIEIMKTLLAALLLFDTVYGRAKIERREMETLLSVGVSQQRLF